MGWLHSMVRRWFRKQAACCRRCCPTGVWAALRQLPRREKVRTRASGAPGWNTVTLQSAVGPQGNRHELGAGQVSGRPAASAEHGQPAWSERRSGPGQCAGSAGKVASEPRSRLRLRDTLYRRIARPVASRLPGSGRRSPRRPRTASAERNAIRLTGISMGIFPDSKRVIPVRPVNGPTVSWEKKPRKESRSARIEVPMEERTDVSEGIPGGMRARHRANKIGYLKKKTRIPREPEMVFPTATPENKGRFHRKANRILRVSPRGWRRSSRAA